MSNDERVEALSKQLDVTLEYSDKINYRQTIKPDKKKLKSLATKIRKNLKETSVEAPTHSHTGI